MFFDALFAHDAQVQTNNVNRDIASQNIAFQQRENEITRAREDNAVQRRAADLSAAGLSQTLAAGNPASAQALTAPHNDYQHVSPMQKALERIDIGSSLLDLKSKALAIKQQQAEVDKTNAETASVNLNNGVFMDRFNAEHGLTLAQIEQSRKQLQVYDSTIRLNNITGEVTSKKVSYEIDNLVANRKYTEMNTRKAANEITRIVNDTYKLTKEAESIVYDIIYKKLEIEKSVHNLAYARLFNLPVGSMPNGIFGQSMNAAQAFASWLKNGAQKPNSFTFNEATGLYTNYDSNGTPYYSTTPVETGLKDSYYYLKNGILPEVI